MPSDESQRDHAAEIRRVRNAQRTIVREQLDKGMSTLYGTSRSQVRRALKEADKLLQQPVVRQRVEPVAAPVPPKIESTVDEFAPRALTLADDGAGGTARPPGNTVPARLLVVLEDTYEVQTRNIVVH